MGDVRSFNSVIGYLYAPKFWVGIEQKAIRIVFKHNLKTPAKKIDYKKKSNLTLGVVNCICSKADRRR